MKTFSAAHVKQYLADARRDMNNSCFGCHSYEHECGVCGHTALHPSQ